MKYLMKYEEITNHLFYNEGDYVLLDIDKINKDIIEFEYSDHKMNPDDKFGVILATQDMPYPYVIKTYYPGDDENGIVIKIDEIKRLMTSEEIEKYNLDKITNKFNI